jgi:hypothetical protein
MPVTRSSLVQRGKTLVPHMRDAAPNKNTEDSIHSIDPAGIVYGVPVYGVSVYKSRIP